MMNNAERFAQDLMRRYPQAEQYPFRSWCYAQGFYLWGFIRLYELTGKQEYLHYVREYVDLHVSEDGSIAGFTGESLDDVMTGSVIVWLYSVDKQEKYQRAAERVRRAFDDYPRNPDGGFWHARGMRGEMWVDGLFMGLMFLTRYGALVEDREACFAETIRQLNVVFARCQKDKTGLLYHAYDEYASKSWASRINGCAPEVWCEGLGWYAMILSEVLALIPQDYPGWESVHEQLKLLCRDLVRAQDPGCGLWYQVVDRPRYSKNFHDTSGSAMFLYTIKKALDQHLIEGEEYENAVRKGYRGLLTKIVAGIDGGYHVLDACNGLGVQNNYDAYVHFPKTVDAQEAVAAVLWALIAVEMGTLAD